jgi:hypothetical protein
MMLNVIEELKEIKNPKWTEEQHTAYLTFLKDLYDYIVNWVFKLQIPYYEDFFAWIDCIKTQYNPVGVYLYEIQLDYYQKKM